VIDPRPFQAQYQQALAQKARDEAILKNSQLDLDRYTLLWQQDSISKQIYDTQRASVEQLKATVQADQALVDNARLQLDYTTIRAPLSGRTGARLVDPGNIVRATDNNGIVVINQIDPITVVFTLPEDAVSDINRALRASRKPLAVLAFARSGKEPLASGSLLLMNNQIDASTGTVQLKAQFVNKTHALWPGQFVNVRLVLGERAQALTRHLLAYSRKQVLEPRILDLSHLVRDTEKLLRRVVPEHITLCTALAPDVGHVAADPGQLEQVLVNLVINARDAMPQGGRLTVETANAQVDRLLAREHLGLLEGPYVVLTVSDTGCGMDSATLARIFEPFFTTKAMGQGTGLGLSTVYGIVKQSGGHVWAESEPGRGSVFKVYLPVVHADATSCGEVLSHGWMLARPGESVLLVEDDPDVRATAVRALEFLGYKVLAADGLLAATAHLVTLERPLDLLLTDVVMPGASGPQVAQELRRRQPGLRILFMSGYLDEVVTSRVPLPAGAAFLDKPF
ncbi:MAG: efflux RND transporter periplasmic adaptor subunit, partial [Deltaproteobacteria bacterium]